MRYHFRRTLLLVMAFLTFNVGATPLAAVANMDSSLTRSAKTFCAMTRQLGCGCCHNADGDKIAAQSGDKKADGNDAHKAASAKAEMAKGRCACNVTPAPATPSAPVSSIVAPVVLYVAPLPIVTAYASVFFPEAATPPVGSHAPPRSVALAANAGRAPPTF
jgi:hypothetical protein